jgi:plasmid stabilization system protein ParE
MPNPKVLSVFWTERALQNAVSIKSYLSSNFSFKEVENFFAILQTFEIAVGAFPKLYPSSTLKKNVRRAVLSHFLSAYYRIHKGKIEIISLLDNRCDISRWL